LEDVWRCRAGEVGVEPAERAALFELLPRQGADAGRGVTLPTQLARRVDEIDPHAVRRLPRPRGHRGKAAVLPDVQPSPLDGARDDCAGVEVLLNPRFRHEYIGPRGEQGNVLAGG